MPGGARRRWEGGTGEVSPDHPRVANAALAMTARLNGRPNLNSCHATILASNAGHDEHDETETLARNR